MPVRDIDFAALRDLRGRFGAAYPRGRVLFHAGDTVRHHPLVGRLQLQHVSFSVMDDPELTLTIMAPARTTDSVAKLQQIIDRSKLSHGSSDQDPYRNSTIHLNAKARTTVDQ